MIRTLSLNMTAAKCVVFITIIAAVLILPASAMAKTAMIETPLGNIEIELLEEDAPNTVANFLEYIENDKYVNSFIHRSARYPDNSPFVIQGGGFTITGPNTAPGIVAFPPVANEFKISNTRGTVAMARLGGQPDSATSQWFINLADNSENLDNVDSGFTVFARVVGDGMQVADAISELPITVASSPFQELPTIDYTAPDPVLEENLVMTAISTSSSPPNPQPFVMNPGLNDAWYNPLTDGQGFFITVFPDKGLVSLAWFTYDTDLPAPDESANLGDPGHRWLTAIGPIVGDMAVMNIDIVTGGQFDSDTEVDHTTPVGSEGTITLSFENCSSGLVEYDITSINQQGSVPIERVVDDNVMLCETLTGE
jgi:cyclophilin family peptidyl-prolyl cis-trans isomerase